VLGHGFRRHVLERDAAGKVIRVVAVGAVFLQQREALLLPLLRGARDEHGHHGPETDHRDPGNPEITSHEESCAWQP
jgi:hypothetical protein